MTAGVPILLPPNSLPRPSHPTLEWTPKRYLTGPQPPPVDDARVLEQELAAARQLADGKAVKKTRPRRTVDFNGGMGRWTLVRARFPYGICPHSMLPSQLRKHRPNPTYVPLIRPAPPYIVDVGVIFNRHDPVHAERMITLISFSRPSPTRATHPRRCAPSSYTPRRTRFVVRSTSSRSVLNCIRLASTHLLDRLWFSSGRPRGDAY